VLCLRRSDSERRVILILDDSAIFIGSVTVTAKALEARTSELSQCVDGFQPGRYAQGNRAYTMAELLRMRNFMRRQPNAAVL
jgi:hypothetical protein